MSVGEHSSGAGSMFQVMDTNRDGTLSAVPWIAGRSTRQVSTPLTKDRATSNTGSIRDAMNDRNPREDEHGPGRLEESAVLWRMLLRRLCAPRPLCRLAQ